MDKSALVNYWRAFFSDLMVGTFRRILLFSLQGLVAGVLAALFWKWFSFDSTAADFGGWLQGIFIFVACLWYAILGTLHGLAVAFITTVNRKFSEAVGGLHDLFDFLSRGVLQNTPKLNRTIPKEEMAQKFDDFGKAFLRDLRLRKGIVQWFAGLGFAVLLKIFKILFLNNVAEEISRKPGSEVTSSDIESAVRRVGVEAILNPVTDYLLLMHIINFVLLIISFGAPFFLIWVFGP